ncbi:MAG: hypothetical protein JST36_02345 [Bacteroidetes bacterium]|nr:hypothetical protein [Bacteroidota bacterium]
MIAYSLNADFLNLVFDGLILGKPPYVTMPFYSKFSNWAIPIFLAGTLSLTSCYSYKLATKAQSSTDYSKETTIHAYSLFWGLMVKPQVLRPKNCDDLQLGGVSEVVIKTNFGNTLLTLATLGIYCPVRVSWKCSKPCGNPDSEEL